jgi:3-deoxy-D-manno-octulosonate 8-phosphate phosphatase (KDO 8-P phosphatase)
MKRQQNSRRRKIRSEDIELIVYDFDGVMTNNTFMLREDGMESVIVNRSDGLAVEILKSKGIPQLILSKEHNKIVRTRAAKLGIPVLQGIDDKKTVLLEYCKRNAVDLKNIVYIGNDLNDAPVMNVVGFPIAPQDAYPEAKKAAKFIIATHGGGGVIRELLNIIRFEETKHGRDHKSK